MLYSVQFLVARVTSHPNKHLLLFLKLFEEVKERFLPGGQVCPKLACFFQNLLDFVSGKFLVFPSLLHHLVQNRLKPVHDLTVSPHEPLPELLWSSSHLLFSSRFSFCSAPAAASGSFCLRRSTFTIGPAGSSCHHGAQTDRPPSTGTLAVPREPGSSNLASGALPEGGACVLRTACVRPNDGAGLQRLSFRSGWNLRNKDSILKADSLNEVPHCPRLCISAGSRRSGPRQALTPADATGRLLSGWWAPRRREDFPPWCGPHQLESLPLRLKVLVGWEVSSPRCRPSLPLVATRQAARPGGYLGPVLAPVPNGFRLGSASVSQSKL